MNLASIRNIFSTSQKVGDRARRQGKQGAFEQALSEGTEDEDSPEESAKRAKNKGENLQSRKRKGLAGFHHLAKKKPMRQKSGAKGLKIDLFA